MPPEPDARHGPAEACLLVCAMLPDEVPTSDARPPRLRRVTVRKLFGWLDHEIELRHDERVTILIGPNGVGKTCLLELLAAVSYGRVDHLVRVPFDELRLDFEGEKALVIRRRQDAAPIVPFGPVRPPPRFLRRQLVQPIELVLLGGGIEVEAWRPKEHLFDQRDDWTEPSPLLSRPDLGEVWRARSGGGGNAVRQGPAYSLGAAVADSEAPEWFRGLFGPTHLIETQRLFRARPASPGGPDDDEPLALAVGEVAKDLIRRIVTMQRRYAHEAQRLEKTYVERLLSHGSAREGDVDRLVERLDDLSRRRTRLEGLGLLTQGEASGSMPAGRPSAEQIGVLALFADDLQSKLDVLEPLASAIELLLNGLNAKLRGKRLRLAEHEGLVVECEPDARRIPVEALSSGEQHQLVLLFDLIFRIRPGTLVLIDEPELSLHPEWQQQFLDDLLHIAKASELDVLVATHSPYIVASHHNLCVSLRAEQSA